MAPSIDIDEDVMDRLKLEAEPFVDTPNTVLRRLLGLGGDGQVDEREAVKSEVIARVAPGAHGRKPRRKVQPGKHRRAPRGSLLSEAEYELPILRYIDEHGGRAPSREVVDAVGETLKDRFTEADTDTLKSGEIRWKSRTAFVRLRLVESGDLDGNAPRGTWQITDQGRARVQAGA